MLSEYKKQIFWILASVMVVAAGLASFNCKNHLYIGSDPLGTVLVSEQIIDNHSIRLDHYKETIPLYKSRMHEKNGHIYYYFPLGTPLVITPIVLAFKAYGANIQESEPLIQIVTAAITSAVTLALLITLGRFFVSPLVSVLISSAVWFGSPLASTSGTALWSHNFAVIFCLIAIISSIKIVRKNNICIVNLLLASSGIFISYLCRPTMAIFAFSALLFLTINNIRRGVLVGLAIVPMMILFVTFSESEFGQILPDYYMPGRLGSEINWNTIEGVFFSPARGLFVYMPYLIIALAFSVPFIRGGSLKEPWVIFGLFWTSMHMYVILTFNPWSGGHAFGPRLATDIMPGLFVLIIYTLANKVAHNKSVLYVSYFLTFLFSIYVHTAQGLFNEWSSAWNREPFDSEKYYFDWEYPQFMSSEYGHKKRLVRDGMSK